MEAFITKKEILDKSNGGAQCDAYTEYLVHGRIVNDEGTRYRPFKFVYLIYKDDLFEYDGYPEYMSAKRQAEITTEMLASCLVYIKGYDDCNDFFDFCNRTIRQYNDHRRRSAC